MSAAARAALCLFALAVGSLALIIGVASLLVLVAAIALLRWLRG